MEALNHEKEEVKILIMGLTNAGKTSIVLSMKNEVNLMNYLSLKPTKGYQISELEGEEARYYIWDLGGQYIESHMLSICCTMPPSREWSTR